nr:unnamed protein product [Digitaria exilis]
MRRPKPMIAGGEKNMMGAQQAGRQTGGRTDRHRQELLIACPSDKKDLSFSSFLPHCCEKWNWRCDGKDEIEQKKGTAGGTDFSRRWRLDRCASLLPATDECSTAVSCGLWPVILSSCRCLVAGAEPPDTWPPPPPLAEARFVAGWLEHVAIALHRLDE